MRAAHTALTARRISEHRAAGRFAEDALGPTSEATSRGTFVRDADGSTVEFARTVA